MAKTRAVSSSSSSLQQQRREARAASRKEDLDDDDDGQEAAHTHAQTGSHRPTPLRSMLEPEKLVPATAVHALAVAYSVLLSSGRPRSLWNLDALLQPLMRTTVKTIARQLFALVLVELYFGAQLRRWQQAADRASRELAKDTADPGSSATTVRIADDSSTALIKTTLDTLCALACFAAIIFALSIAMTAPVTRLVAETALLSLFLSLLAFSVPLSVLGSPFTRLFGNAAQTSELAAIRLRWQRVFARFDPRSDIEIAVLLPAGGAVLGAMFGVIPEGLDWERPWQKWPVPSIIGSFVGWLAAQVIVLFLCSLMWSARGKGRHRIRAHFDAQIQKQE